MSVNTLLYISTGCHNLNIESSADQTFLKALGHVS